MHEGLRVFVTVLEGGTLTSSAGIVCRCKYGPVGCGTHGVEEGRFVGTLLGPEGAGRPGDRGDVISDRALLFSYRHVPCGGAWVRRGRRGGDWSYVENCTVDASIF